jgi:hypothetical protein
VKYIKQYSNNKQEIHLKLIYQECFSESLINIRKEGYEPKVCADTSHNSVFRITLEIENIYISIEGFDVNTQDESIQHVENVEEYKQFKKADSDFYFKIMQKEYISTHHESVLEIEDKYKLHAVRGKFKTDHTNTVTGIDNNNAYPTNMRQIIQVPVFSYFDVYRPYLGEEIDDLTYYLVEYNGDARFSQILFEEVYSRTFGFLLKKMKLKVKILHYRKPSHIIDVDFKTPIDEVFSNKNLSKNLKKYIANKITGLIEKKENKSQNTKIFEDCAEAKYYAEKYGGQMIPIQEIYQIFGVQQIIILQMSMQNRRYQLSHILLHWKKNRQ